MTGEDRTTPRPSVHEAAMAVAAQAEPDDDFDGQFVDYLVPAEAMHALRAALVRAALSTTPAPDPLREALERIANMDYRGNPSQEQEVARTALRTYRRDRIYGKTP